MRTRDHQKRRASFQSSHQSNYTPNRVKIILNNIKKMFGYCGPQQGKNAQKLAAAAHSEYTHGAG